MNNDRVARMYRWTIVIAIVGVFLTLLIFLVILPLVERSSKLAYLDVLVTPAETEVIIDGKTYANAVYEMEPGLYTATVKKNNVETKKYELYLVQNQTTSLYLTIDDQGWRQLTLTEIEQQNSIATVTPIYFSICGTPAKRTNCDALSINYGRNKKCNYNHCLIISGRSYQLTDSTLEEARKQLADKGYDLANYQYIYLQNDYR